AVLLSFLISFDAHADKRTHHKRVRALKTPNLVLLGVDYGTTDPLALANKTAFVARVTIKSARRTAPGKLVPLDVFAVPADVKLKSSRSAIPNSAIRIGTGFLKNLKKGRGTYAVRIVGAPRALEAK